MALILEVRDRRGSVTLHRLEQLPVTLGRGLSNTIVLEDPYVDAKHARIALDDGGGLTIEDLESLNGIIANGTRLIGRLTVAAPGMEVKLGRTTLRFRDTEEVVPPAVLESSQRLPHGIRWMATARGAAVLVGALAILAGTNAWLGSTERSTGATILGAILAAVIWVMTWAAIWAASARGADRRFRLSPHLAIITVATLLMLVSTSVNDWLTFLFPDAVVLPVLYSALLLAILAVMIVAHLSVPGIMTRRGRWRVGLGVAGGLLAIVVLSELVDDDKKFSDVPEFPAVLKPIAPELVPTSTVDEFIVTMAKARSEADKARTR